MTESIHYPGFWVKVYFRYAHSVDRAGRNTTGFLHAPFDCNQKPAARGKGETRAKSGKSDPCR